VYIYIYIYFRIGPSDLFAPVFCGDFASVLADITESEKQGVRIKSKACRVILYFLLYPHHRISRSPHFSRRKKLEKCLNLIYCSNKVDMLSLCKYIN
jgi:hypothetical protein